MLLYFCLRSSLRLFDVFFYHSLVESSFKEGIKPTLIFKKSILCIMHLRLRYFRVTEKSAFYTCALAIIELRATGRSKLLDNLESLCQYSNSRKLRSIGKYQY